MLAVKTRSKTDYIDYGNTPYTNWEKEWGIKGIGADPMVDPQGTPAADICLLVDKGQWKGALYWLYGDRLDQFSRSIRYGIVGGGQLGDGDAVIFYRLCAHALGGREQQDELARLLDTHFDAAVIQELHDKQKASKEEAYQQVRGILHQVAKQLPSPTATRVSDTVAGGLECSPDMEGCKEKFRQSLCTVATANFHCANPMLLLYGTSLRVSVEDLQAKKMAGLVVLPNVPKLEPKRRPPSTPPRQPVQKKSKLPWVTLVAGIVLGCALSIVLSYVATSLKLWFSGNREHPEIIRLREEVSASQQKITGLKSKMQELGFSFVLATGQDNWHEVLSLYKDEAVSSKPESYRPEDQFQIVGAIPSVAGKLVFVYHSKAAGEAQEVQRLVVFKDGKLYGEYEGCPKPKGISEGKLKFTMSNDDVRPIDFSKDIPSSINLEGQEYQFNQYQPTTTAPTN